MSSTSSSSIVASAPGKVILSGEHAVVHMAHALATVIHQRTYVEIVTTQDDTVSLHILHNQLTEEFSWSLQTLQSVAQQYQHLLPTPSTPCPSSSSLDTSRSFAPFITLSHVTSPTAIVFLLYHVLITGAVTGCRIRIKSELPMGAGLGSSASFCSALATAFYHIYHLHGTGKTTPLTSCTCSISLCQHQRDIINQWSYQGERVLHGNPSGVDNTCSVYGGVIMYKKGEPITFLKQLPSVHLLITNTRISRDTKKLVAAVGTLLQSYPTIITPLITSMDQISQSWCDAIMKLQTSVGNEKSSEEEKLGMEIEFMKQVASLIRINQSLLNAIGVGHSSIDQIVSISQKYNISSKLTGAGGGGCVISLLPSSQSSSQISQFQSELITHGYEAFTTQIGTDGIRLHINTTLEQIVKS